MIKTYFRSCSLIICFYSKFYGRRCQISKIKNNMQKKKSLWGNNSFPKKCSKRELGWSMFKPIRQPKFRNPLRILVQLNFQVGFLCFYLRSIGTFIIFSIDNNQKSNKEMFCTAYENIPISNQDTVKKIGSYLFRYSDVLGSGNFSTVYSGVDQNTGRQVAVKVVRMSSLKSKTALKLLEQQIQILKDLDHVNVIKCFDELTSINNCYIITELCTGDLDKKLKEKGRFEEMEISKCVWDILKGLQYLENNSIIHRDLKLSNIFLSQNGNVKIADFGFAIKNKDKFKDLNIGSPIYMSPEGLIHNQYGPKTDIWALGIIIYELLHGDTPLENCKTEVELKKKVLEPPFFRVKVSVDLKKFIQCCLKVNQSERFTVAQLMDTPYARRLRYEMDGSKNFKTYSSGYNSTFNSTTELSTGSQNLNRFSIFEEISYDTAVSLLHYCRLVHKTCQRVRSQILSQWLLNVSYELLKAKISRNHTDKEQYEKLRSVVIEYHNKYQKQHEDFKTDVMICDVLKECEMVQKFADLKQYISVLLKETKLLRLWMEKRKFEEFGRCSESKKFLAFISTNQNTAK